MSVAGSLSVRVGVASRALAGEPVSGDRAVIARTSGAVLLGAVDGLGHGAPAADAAARAVALLEDQMEQPIDKLLELCHEALRHTRGAAITLARVEPEAARLTWGGVGNVAAVVVSQHGVRPTHALVTPGVVGFRLPATLVTSVELGSGDLIAIATDGLEPRFVDEVSTAGGVPVQEVADGLLKRFAKLGDDALILVARCERAT